MRRSIVIGFLATLLVVSMLPVAFYIHPAKAGTIVVPDDYSTIQEALDAASDGDTIFVRRGLYQNDGVYVNKSVSIIGENPLTTQLETDWGAQGGFYVESSEVTIEGFAIQGGLRGVQIGNDHVTHASINHITISNNIIFNINTGIYMDNVTDSLVADNEINQGYVGGIFLSSCSNNIIMNNTIRSFEFGAFFQGASSGNVLSENTIADNEYAFLFSLAASNYAIYHNTFENNQWILHPESGGFEQFVWDDGYPSGGNYWSDYLERYPSADELDGSGIWDIPYTIDATNQDNYPLIRPLTQKFLRNERVRTTANLNVREGPGLSYPIIDTMPLGTLGQVFIGPRRADGFNWWSVAYDVGVEGWSAEDWLELYEPTVCVVRLQKDGVEIDDIVIGELFDIYAGDSVGDIGQVRFSSDDAQDGTPVGVWTEWYDWGTSSGDWDASTRIKRWAFASYGYKEVWAEVIDTYGIVSRCSADILAVLPLPEWKEAYAPNPWGYSFGNNKAVDRNIPVLPGDESLTNQSRWDIFASTFDLSNVDEETAKEYFRVLDVEKEAFTGAYCYGMAASSLMEFMYPNYDQFLENQGMSTIFQLEEPDTLFLDPFSLLRPRWHGGGEEGPDPVLEHIIKFHLYQFGKPAQSATIEEPLGLLQKLEEDLSNGEMYVLGIGYMAIRDNKPVYGGHAVVPYQVDGQNILVYDPNWPNNDERRIEIYEEEGVWKWRYGMGARAVWPPDDYKQTFLMLYPIEALYNSGEKPDCAVASDSHETLFYIDGKADLLLIDSEGRSTGLRDGSFMQEIPDVRPIVTFGALTDEEARPWGQAYRANRDNESTIMINGSGENGAYSLTKFGPGYFARISGSSICNGVDNITITSNGAIIHVSQSQEPKTYNLAFNKNMNGVSLAFAAPTFLQNPEQSISTLLIGILSPWAKKASLFKWTLMAMATSSTISLQTTSLAALNT